MKVMSLKVATSIVGHMFETSERLKAKLLKMSGPDTFCYDSETMLAFIEGRLMLKQAAIVKKHTLECDWCHHLAAYGVVLGSELKEAEKINQEAAEQYAYLKIFRDIYSPKSPLAQKIKKAWNII